MSIIALYKSLRLLTDVHSGAAAKLSIITARSYDSAVYAVVVWPSVGLSVTSRHCTKTAKRRITQTTPYDSPESSFYAKDLRRNSKGWSPTAAPSRAGVC